MSFAAQSAAMDAAIAATLTDPGAVEPINGDPTVSVPVILNQAYELDSFGMSKPVRGKATVEIPTASLPTLNKDDIVIFDGRRWRVTGAPIRPDLAWWFADVTDAGEA